MKAMQGSVPTAHDIEVIDIKPIIGRGNLKAFVSVRIGAIEIHGLRIVQQPGQRAWVSMPQVESCDRDGKKCYAPLVTIHDEALKSSITEAVLSRCAATLKLT